MTSPMLTVVVLAVLWLIVVVPMIVRRKDESSGQRSAARFGSAMKALSSRRAVVLGEDEAPASPLNTERAKPTVHVPGAVSRRPVPAAKESLMYPPDRHDMSESRRQMMARRRRSLTILGAGAAIMLLASLITGSGIAWTLAVLFVLSLGGYLWFLRSQALRDRDRRENRKLRANTRPSRDYDATSVVPAPARPVETVVRIDEDDVELDHLDTVDLTGLYSEREIDGERLRRAG